MEIPLWFPTNAGVELSALFVTPDGWLNAPVVVFCRGDASPLANGQDQRIAERLRDRGIASLLLDFSSPTQPPGQLTDEMLERPIEDIGSAIDELRLQRGVDVGRIGVTGTDLAGTAALLRAAMDPRIRALVLRSTYAPTTRLPTSTIPAPTLIIVGDDDKPVLAGTRRLERWLAGPFEFVFIPGAGHHFVNHEAFETAATHTVEWFVRYLGTGLKSRAA